MGQPRIVIEGGRPYSQTYFIYDLTDPSEPITEKKLDEFRLYGKFVYSIHESGLRKE